MLNDFSRHISIAAPWSSVCAHSSQGAQAFALDGTGLTGKLWDRGGPLTDECEPAKTHGGIWRLMPYRSFNDPEHWRERAEEARAHAEQMTDPEAKRTMLEIAEDYEKLARRAQERLVWEQKSGQPT